MDKKVIKEAIKKAKSSLTIEDVEDNLEAFFECEASRKMGAVGKKDAGDVLTPILQQLEGKTLFTRDGSGVKLATKKERDKATKKKLEAHFGKEEVKKFWAKLEEKEKEYLSIVEESK